MDTACPACQSPLPEFPTRWRAGVAICGDCFANKAAKDFDTPVAPDPVR